MEDEEVKNALIEGCVKAKKKRMYILREERKMYIEMFNSLKNVMSKQNKI